MSHLLHRFVIVIGLALCSATGLAERALAAPITTDEVMADRVLGNANAPITMIDFSSLTCPHCADFNTNTLPLIKKKYIDTGKLKLIFRDFPLDQYALKAAMLARCAKPALYFGFIDVLFKDQSQWEHASEPQKALAQIGALGGVSAADFDACMSNKALSDALLAKQLEAQKAYDIKSTPTFVFNNGADKIEGARGIETFEEVIDRLLSH